jgi:hypothetical protein
MIQNWHIIFVAALVPMVMGFVWYNPKVIGTIWMAETGMTEEKSEKTHMPLVFGLSYLFSCMIAVALLVFTIHQIHVFSVFEGQAGLGVDGSDLMNKIINFLGDDIHNFRTFKHGAFHGTLAGVLLALPILATNAMFEAKGFKYIAVNAGYWIISLALMGGIVCQWA